MPTMTQSAITFAAEDNKAFTYAKPSGNYGFALGPQLDSPAAPAITDNGDGTGTLKFGGPVTGSIDIWTVQKP